MQASKWLTAEQTLRQSWGRPKLTNDGAICATQSPHLQVTLQTELKAP